MALFRKFFYRKPPDGLLEISKRVYVFDSCFKTDVLEGDEYKVYMEGIVAQLHDQFPDASFVVFNFREGVNPSQISSILSEYDMAVMEYPRQYEGCPLLTMEMLHHFLRSCESWLLLGQQNILLMHCERGGWPVLAFMLAALLVYRKQYAGEQRALDMIYKQAPRELLQLLSPLNPLPSQLRYLHYISNRNVGSQWPPLDRALTLNCIILRCLPNCDGMDGCRPLFRIYGQDPLLAADPTPKVLFSTPKKSKSVHFYKQDCELVKFDIHSHIQGDVVLECISLDDDLEREQMMFRVMFNTAFIRSNILMLDRDSIDILWDAKDRFPKDFRVEILFSEMNAANSLISLELISGEDTEGLSTEAFTRVNEIFNNFDWLDTNADAATQVLQHIASSKSLQEKVDAFCPYKSEVDILLTKSSADTLQEEDVSGETYDRNKKSLTSSPKSLQHSSSVPLLTDSANYIQEPSSLTTSSISGSTISLKSSQHELSVLLSTTSQSYTEEISRANAHILLSPSPPSAPSPLAPKEVVLAPPSIPLVPLAFATKLEVDTVGEAPASFEPPFRTIKSSITKVPPSPDQKLSYSAPQNSIPSVPSHHGNSTQSTSAPPPPTPYKKISAPSTSAGLEKSASPVRHEALSGNMASKLIPSPPSPPLITSKSPHTSSLPFTKESVLAVPGPYPGSAAATSASPPPPPPHIFPKHSVDFDSKASSSTPLPPPPAPPDFVKGPTFADISGGKCANCEVIPPPPPCGLSALTLGGHGRLLTRTSRFMLYNQSSTRKSNLKPLHWIKVTRAVQGSLWAESPDCDEFLKTPEFDMSELERLFSVAMPTPNLQGSGSKSGRSLGSKSDKIHLIDLRRANNCEIMLTKVKMPLNDLLSSVLTLDDSVLDVDQIENLIKFCPTKEEMELLTGYNGDKGNLGKCEQYFLELMKVPRVESKLRVFSFKIQFRSQVTDLKRNLNVVNSSAEETRSSIKLKRIMQTILSLGNALNQGTARGSAVGFRLDSLLKLSETRARNNKITLMHYLCKVLAEQLPELIDFPKDLVSLEVAAKMQLKILAEEMQAINKGLEKVEQELAASERDGPVSQVFCETLKEFLVGAEAEVKALTLLYSSVGRNADALALYFGEDPARCPFEQVVTTLLNFVKMFMRAHEENCKHLELEKKKALKEAESEKVKTSSGTKEL